MAQLAVTSGNQRKGRSRSLKQLPQVDLTAMVDLAFLLITFFMLTTTLAKSNSMNLTMPVDSRVGMNVSEKRTMTICIGGDDKLLWYTGMFSSPKSKLNISTASKKEIRKALIQTTKQVAAATGKGLIVLIKPSTKANYKSLVNVLDELNITRVEQYAIVDISNEEISSLKQKGLL